MKSDYHSLKRDDDPSAGSPTETLLLTFTSLNDQVWPDLFAQSIWIDKYDKGNWPKKVPLKSIF